MSPDKPEKEGSTSGGSPPGAGNWPPELQDLQRRGGMPPDWHEVTHGRGRGVGPLPNEYKPSSGGSPGSGQQRIRGRKKKIAPPRLFSEVADRLGFAPPEKPPSPPPIEVDDWVTPENRPPDFWDPGKDGGEFGDRANSNEGPPEKIGEPPRIDEESDPPPRIEPGADHGFTAEAIAYYHPWHAGGDEYWGIYFREKNMNHYIERVERIFGWRNLRDVITEQVLQHELEHFEQEKAVFLLEDMLDQGDLHSKWVGKRRDIEVELFDRKRNRIVGVRMVQEALATAREIDWAKRQERTGFCPPGYAAFLDWDSRSAPPGYRDFHLCVGPSQRREGLAAYLESVGSVAEPSPVPRMTGHAARIFFGGRTRTGNAQVPIYTVSN